MACTYFAGHRLNRPMLCKYHQMHLMLGKCDVSCVPQNQPYHQMHLMLGKCDVSCVPQNQPYYQMPLTCSAPGPVGMGL